MFEVLRVKWCFAYYVVCCMRSKVVAHCTLAPEVNAREGGRCGRGCRRWVVVGARQRPANCRACKRFIVGNLRIQCDVS